MQPVFILSYPRSRTAWLAAYLTGAGVPCFHEAWKLADSAEAFRTLMESKGPGPVVNSDSSNVFFLPELQQTFPHATYIRIVNDLDAVLASLRASYGEYDYRGAMACYEAAFASPVSVAMTMDCRTWTEDTMRELWALLVGALPFDREWYTQMTGMLVQLMPEQIAHDIARVRAGALNHIIHATMRWRATSWVSG